MCHQLLLLNQPKAQQQQGDTEAEKIEQKQQAHGMEERKETMEKREEPHLAALLGERLCQRRRSLAGGGGCDVPVVGEGTITRSSRYKERNRADLRWERARR